MKNGILPLAMAERAVARPKDDKARFVLPALLTSCGVGRGFAIARFAACIREPAEMPARDALLSARATPTSFHFGVPPIVDDESSHSCTRRSRSTFGSDRSGRPSSAPTYSELGRELATGALDAALLPPLAYAIAHRHGGVEPALQALGAGRDLRVGRDRTLPRLASLADLVVHVSRSRAPTRSAATSRRRPRCAKGRSPRSISGSASSRAITGACWRCSRTGRSTRPRPTTRSSRRSDASTRRARASRVWTALPNDLVAVHPELDDRVEGLLVDALRELPTEVTTPSRARHRTLRRGRSELARQAAPWTEAW
ncbi:MAG: hypothetical protein R3B99_21100 [Polyangiales bacterium]